MSFELFNPGPLGRPRGWTNGVLAPAGWRMLFVAGQNAADDRGRVAVTDFVAQFDEVLRKSLIVVREAGGAPEHVARITVYVTDIDAYRQGRRALRDVWSRHMGSYYPAMALVEVSRLVDEGAMIEIEVTAMLPPAGSPSAA